MQAVKKSALSCTARAVLHSTFLPELERDSGEHSRYCAFLTSGFCTHFAYPKDQACVLTVTLFFWSSYCSKTLLLINPLWRYFLCQYIYFNTPSQSQRQGMSSVTIVWCCVLPARNTDPGAGFSLPLCLLLLVWPWQLQCNRCLFLTCLSTWERLQWPQLQCQLWTVSKLLFKVFSHSLA